MASRQRPASERFPRGRPAWTAVGLLAAALVLSCSDETTPATGQGGTAQGGAAGAGGSSGGSGGAVGGAAPSGSPVRIHPTRSGLFAGGRDDAAVLTFAGSHAWYNIINNPSRGIVDNDAASFDAFLDFMQGHGHNFTRLWSGCAYLSCNPHPWLRTGPGLAQDGEPKFDLSSLDETYFELLRERLSQLEGRGLYASIMFFGSHNRFDSDWINVAWHPDNTVDDVGLDPADGRSFFDLDNAALRDLQETLIRRYVDELNDCDNIVFEIMNEAAFPDSAAWQQAMVEYAKGYEASLPKQHLVGITADFENSNEHLVAGPHDWWSPDRMLVDGYDYRDGGPADYAAKPVIVDSDHFDGGLYEPSQVAVGVDRVWKVFLRGNHPIFMDCYTATWSAPQYACTGVVNPVFDPIRDALGATLALAGGLHDFAATLPSETACSTAYCLVNPGHDYVVYQPSTGSVDVSLEAGEYQYEWSDPMTGSPTGSGAVTSSGGTETLDPPHSGMALLWITRGDSS